MDFSALIRLAGVLLVVKTVFDRQLFGDAICGVAEQFVASVDAEALVLDGGGHGRGDIGGVFRFFGISSNASGG